jgi:hypothetical protein
MIIIIIILFIALATSFGMLMFKLWQIKTMRVIVPEDIKNKLPKLEFRHVEKNMLYLTKHVVLGVMLAIVKYWFIATTKIKKWVAEEWPKIHAYFTKKPESGDPVRLSFIRRSIIELKIKIKKIKDKIREEHE